MDNKKKNIFILGSYGCNNRGDEAILSSIIYVLKEVGEITVANGKFDDMKKYFAVKTVSCRLSEGKITGKLLLKMLLDSYKQAKAVIKSDMLIYGGGSSIHDLTFYNLIYMFFWQWLAQTCKKKVCYISMGVGPIDTKLGRTLCRHFLVKADRLYVRDWRGYEICCSLGASNVKLSSDLAFYKKNQKDTIDFEEKKGEYITVSACAWFESINFWQREKMNFDKKIKALSDCLKSIYIRYKKKLIFVPTFGYDEELGHKLEKILSTEIIYCLSKDLSYQHVSKIIGSAWLHIGMRMHSIIFALREGVPCISIIYDEKVLQLVKRFEIEKLAINLNEMSVEQMFNVCDYLEESREELILKIRKKSAEMNELSEVCLKDIYNLLKK